MATPSSAATTEHPIDFVDDFRKYWQESDEGCDAVASEMALFDAAVKRLRKCGTDELSPAEFAVLFDSDADSVKFRLLKKEWSALDEDSLRDKVAGLKRLHSCLKEVADAAESFDSLGSFLGPDSLAGYDPRN